MAPKSKRRSSTVSVDFTGVQSRQRLPEDDYLVRVDEVNNTESQAGNDQLEFIFKVKEGKYEGNNLWFYCPLQENSLWKLHGLLTALGIDVPDDEMEIDLEELTDKEVMAVVTHEVYEGTKRSKMTDFYPIEEPSSPKKTDGASAKSKPKVEDEEEEEEEEEEKPMTEAEKRRARREARKQKKAAAASPKSKAKVEDDEDEEEEAPPPKKTAASKKPATKKMPKLSSDSIQEMDEDDLQEVIDEYKLDVDLDDFKTLRKKAAAVVDALETEDMLDE